jgi:hypothetical protein
MKLDVRSVLANYPSSLRDLDHLDALAHDALPMLGEQVPVRVCLAHDDAAAL